MAGSEGSQEAAAAQGDAGQQQRIQALRELAGQGAGVQGPAQADAARQGGAARGVTNDPITSPFLYTPIPMGPNGADNVGVFPPRDGALVAWRPDGRVVALDAAANDHSVQLYDCATGRLLASLVPLTQNEARNTPHEQGEVNVLRWSPDGSKLLLFDTTLGRVTIWSGAALPH